MIYVLHFEKKVSHAQLFWMATAQRSGKSKIKKTAGGIARYAARKGAQNDDRRDRV